MSGDKLYFLRRIGNITENVIKTIKNAKNVVVFDASLQKDKRGKQKVLFPFLKEYKTTYCSYFTKSLLIHKMPSILMYFVLFLCSSSLCQF